MIEKQKPDNHVLSLDGNGSYVRLPSGIFDGLTEATVEGWVRWESFEDHSRFFDFGTVTDSEWRSIRVEVDSTRIPTLRFCITKGDTSDQTVVEVQGIPPLGRWCHVAAVSGSAGMKLYINGILLGEHSCTDSFASLGETKNNNLGMTSGGSSGSDSFHGQMDEVRVWGVARTQEQIQETMYRQLTGSEEGLVGLWNFEGVGASVTDATGHGHHGTLHGEARHIAMDIGDDLSPGIRIDVGKRFDYEQNIWELTLSAHRWPWVFNYAPLPVTLHIDNPEGKRLLNREIIEQEAFVWRVPRNVGSTLWVEASQTLPSGSMLKGERQRISVDYEPFQPTELWLVTYDGQGPQHQLRQQQARRVDAVQQGASTGRYGLCIEADTQETSSLSRASTHAQLTLEEGRVYTFALFLRSPGRREVVLQAETNVPAWNDRIPQVYCQQEYTVEDIWQEYHVTTPPMTETERVSLVLLLNEGTLYADNLRVYEGVYVPHQPQPVGSVDSTLVMLDGKTPYPGVPLRLERQGEVVAQVQTNEMGHFRHVNLPVGQYQVSAMAQHGPINALQVDPSDPDNADVLHLGAGETHTGQLTLPRLKRGVWSHFDSLDGLVGDEVTALHIDQQGYLWIATTQGLSRFDGKEFVNFTPDDGLPTEWVWCIHEDRQGHLWFGTGYFIGLSPGQGLCRYDGTRFTTYTTEDGLAGNTVFDIKEDAQGNLWIATNNGVSCFDGEYFTDVTQNDEWLKRNILALGLDRQGHPWLALGWPGGVVRFDGTRFVRERDEWVMCIERDVHGTLWFGTQWRSLLRYDEQGWRQYGTNNGLSSSQIGSIYCDSLGCLWFGTGVFVAQTGMGGNAAGVCRYDGECFLTFSERDGLVGNHVSAIVQDAHGQFWFGTGNRGVSRFSPNAFRNDTTLDGLPGSTVTALHSGIQEDVWCGIEGGGVVHFTKDGSVNHGRDTLGSVLVDSIGEDSRGHLWFGFWSYDGVSRYDGEEWFQYPYASHGLGYVKAIHEDRQGQLWLVGYGSSGGLVQYREGQFIIYGEEQGLQRRGEWYNIDCIEEDASGHLWLGHGDGLGVSRFDGEQFVMVTTKDGLPSQTVQAIHRDTKDRLWFGTALGACCYEDGAFRCDVATGVPRADIRSIYEDAAGRLWFGTNGKGVFCYDGVVAQSIDSRDGLIDDHVRDITEDTEGVLWFGTGGGLTLFRMGSVPPVAQVHAVKADQRYAELAALPEFVVGTRLTFEYGAIDLKTYGDKRVYQHRLLGHTRDWSEPTHATEVDYSPRHPGEYMFEVRVIDRDLNYSEPASVVLEVIPDPQSEQIVELESTLARRNQELEHLNTELRAELQDARTMQMSLMPAQSPNIDNAEIAGKCVTANTVGGDFFSYLPGRSNREVGLVIADVAGHAMKGAMNAVLTDGILSVVVQGQRRLHPDTILEEVNDVLARRLERDMNVTMVVGVLDTDAMMLTQANAGHHAHPMLVRNGEIQPLKARGLPLGMRAGVQYREETFDLQLGDVLVLMTDGIIEAHDAEGNTYGESGRLERAMLSFTSDMSAEAMVDTVIQDAIDYGVGEREDDMTVVLAKIG